MSKKDTVDSLRNEFDASGGIPKLSQWLLKESWKNLDPFRIRLQCHDGEFTVHVVGKTGDSGPRGFFCTYRVFTGMSEQSAIRLAEQLITGLLEHAGMCSRYSGGV